MESGLEREQCVGRSDRGVSWGLPGDIPVTGDWNGDGKDDIGIFRPGSGLWSLDSNGNINGTPLTRV